MSPAAVLLACALGIADWGPVRVDAEGVPLPPGVAARLGSSRFRCAGDLGELQFTPDGRQLVGTTARTVHVWDAKTGLRVATHSGFRRIIHFAVAPDGTLALLAATRRELVFIRIDRISGRVLAQKTIEDGHDDIILARDGSRVAQRYGGLVKVHDTADWSLVGDLRFSISDISPNIFGFSPDGKQLAAVFSFNWTEVRDVETGNMPFSGTAGDADSQVQEIAFTPDGRALLRLLYADGKPYRLERVDLATEKATLLLAFENPQLRRGGLIPSRDGNSIHLAVQHEVTRFDLTSRKPTESRTIPFPTIVNRAVLSPDGTTLAVALSTSGIHLYDARTLTKLPQSSDDIVTRAERGRFVADGKRLALLGSGSFQVLDSTTGAIVGQFGAEGDIRVEVHPDGAQYARASLAAVEVRDLATHAIRRSFPWETEAPIIPSFLPNGRQLCANNFSEFRLWNLATGAQEARHDVPGGAMIPLPDGRTALKFRVLDGDTEVTELERVDLATGEPLANWPLQRFANVPGAVDAGFTRLLVPGQRANCGLFDLVEGRMIWVRPRLGSGLESAVFSPDGRSIALRQRRTLQLMEASTGRLRYSVACVESQLPLAFSPDGRHLATLGTSAPIYLWDIRGALKSYPNRLEATTTESLWKDLQGEDAEAAFLALRRLAAAPETTLPFVRARVRPAVAPDPDQLAAWLRDLEAPAFRDREAAMKELKKVMDSIAGDLRAARDRTPSPEIHERLSKLLATTFPETPGAVRRARVVELVEWCGTPGARALLEWWSGGAAGAGLTADAAAARARLR